MGKITIGAKKKNFSNDGFKLNRVYPDGRVEEITAFKDMAEAVKYMSHVNPKTGKAYYDESEQVRKAVERAMANTPASNLGVQLTPKTPIPNDAEMIQGLKEDARKQQYDRLVARAGGNDLEAKYELALMLTQPNDEQREAFGEIQRLTQPEGARPYEQYLKDRNEAGLGPVKYSTPMQSEEELAEYEARKNQESLDFLASLESEVEEEE